MPRHEPPVAVVVALYRSQETLARCLESLRRQTYSSFEVWLIDSSPGDECEEIATAFPELRYVHHPQRLQPQEARALGVEESSGELLAFTDPDCYAEPTWLARLVAAHQRTGGPVVGALACHGDGWLERGIHLCKFSKWLPGRPAVEVDVGPTANLLCPRTSFASVGGFGADPLLGDATLSFALRRTGARLVLVPDASVEHHHLDTLSGFLRERFGRGRHYAALRLREEGGGRGRALFYFLASVLPLRLMSNLFHVVRHVAQAGAWAHLKALPVVALGFAASLAGESLGYARSL